MARNWKQILPTLVNSPVLWDCPLADYTSFGIGGPAEALVKVENREELKRIGRFVHEQKLPWRVIGRGTNILVKDQGCAGIVLVLAGDFKKCHFDVGDELIWVRVGGGLSLNRLTSLCVEQGAAGMEFAMGIPGTVGGAIRMNAGAWGGAIADNLQRVELISAGRFNEYTRAEAQFGYRSFTIAEETSPLITSAVFRLGKTDPQQLRRTCLEYQDKRKKTQPQGRGSAGSIFKNPLGDSAGRLIETCGFKGEKIGDAAVSPKHANFIVNEGHATAENVLQLMKKIRDTVHEKHGILLEPEVQVW